MKNKRTIIVLALVLLVILGLALYLILGNGSKKENTAPTISGAADMTVEAGSSIDVMAGLKAADEEDGDLTAMITVESSPKLTFRNGKATPETAGDYELVYTVADQGGLTDETYALLCGGVPEGVEEKWYYLLVSALDQFYWITGSVLGTLIGGALTMDTTGIDFAMTALFVVIFVEQWLTDKDHIPALLGLGITLLCLVIWGTEGFLIPAMVFILLALSAREFVRERREAAWPGA